ncbi:S-layer homology domain-containing protein [Desulfoscipio geothermicus]|uniref:S-layer homology domain-containing protein n=1 Tax=Desulfoscipio geothermicus DSM 3669 TaxID=1121426 RepID=A0A1I6D7B3_9FIRM|nr:S-layer homology domain-containing protein [Desulfoscipio geothermicus]SFR01217.1 S-layer homology domain-containing protein [Desulfoscipio geothermicus DSM 3669]
MNILNRKSHRYLAFKITLLIFLTTLLVPVLAFVFTGIEDSRAVAAEVYDDLALKAVRNNYNLYQGGKAVDGAYGFGAYDAYVLTQAGANLNTWVYDGTSFKDNVLNLIATTIANKDTENASSAKRVAYEYITAKRWGVEANTLTELLNILKAKQLASGDGSFDQNPYSDMSAFEALGRAGVIGEIDTAGAIAYILGEQDDATGKWCDFLSTAQAVRALTYLKNYSGDQAADVQSAIDKGVNWIQNQQQEDGSFTVSSVWGEFTFWDDKVIDTAEAIITLDLLGIDPATWISEASKSPVDYMKEKALNQDGTFGDYGTSLDNTMALETYLILGGNVAEDTALGISVNPSGAEIIVGDEQQYTAKVCKFDGNEEDVSQLTDWSIDNTDVATVNNSGLVTGVGVGDTVVTATYQSVSGSANVSVTGSVGNSGNNNQQGIIVPIKVIGKNKEILFEGDVTLKESKEWGVTAMGALHATGLSYTEDGGFVNSIAGQANSGMSGWMYKVNNSVPSVLASDKTVNEGDRIIWWYSTDPNSSGPAWDSLVKGNSATDNPAILEEYNNQVTDLQNKIAGGEITPSDAVEETIKIMNNVKNELASPETSVTEAGKTVRDLMEKIIASLIENKNATAVQAAAVLKPVVNDGVKIVLARPDGVDVAGELKNSLASQVRDIITKAGTISSAQLKVFGSDSTTTVSLPANILEQQLEQLSRAQRELSDILSGDRLQEIAVLARTPVQQLEVDLAGVAGQKANTELVVADDVARNLRESELKLAVRVSDGFTIVLSGTERADRQTVFTGHKPVMLAARDTDGLLDLIASGLFSQNEPASSAAEGYVLSVSQLDSAKADKLVRDANANSSSHLTLRPVGKAYTVTVKDLINKEVVNSLAEPLELEMSCRGLTEDPEITGIYRYQDGKFTYVGAKPDKTREMISAKTITGGTFTLLEYDKQFTDLAGHWAEKDIRVLSARHIVSGATPATFAPGQTATRAQCAALLVRALGIPKSNAGHTFTDVSQSAWYAGDVAAAVKAGIIKGTSAGTFSPDKGISRAELAVMISRVLESKTGREVSDLNKVLAKYTDAGQIPDWAKEWIALAVESGIVNGRTADTIVPKGMVNRAEVAVIIGRLLEHIE